MGDDNPGLGHNRIGGVAGDRLRKYIERIERLEEEKKALDDDIKDVFTEVKAAGFDVKIVRQVLRRRKMDASDRDEMDELLAIYERAVQDVLG